MFHNYTNIWVIVKAHTVLHRWGETGGGETHLFLMESQFLSP